MNKLTKSQRLEIYDLILTEQIKPAPVSSTSGGVTTAKSSNQTDKSGKAIPDRPAAGIKVTTVGTAYNMTQVGIAAAAALILIWGVPKVIRSLSRKFGKKAAEQGVSKTQLVVSMTKAAAQKAVFDKVGLTGLMSNVETKLENFNPSAEDDAAAIANGGLTQADARALGDELAKLTVTDFARLQRETAAVAKLAYLSSNATAADLATYLRQSGLMVTAEGKQAAMTWMPILHKIYNGGSKWVRVPIPPNFSNFALTSLFLNNGASLLELINASKLPVTRSILTNAGITARNQQIVQDWVTHSAATEIKNILTSTTMNTEIVSLANKLNTGVAKGARMNFPSYTGWKGVQELGAENTSKTEYTKQKFAYIIWANCR